ncbi:MAG: hypothetical protein LIP77_11075, partial [Planctomycetes bacterium]|nr:hypothetical protein [Planctomycetota bacterium]
MVTTTPQGSRLQTLRMVLAAGLAYSALVMPMSSLSVYIGQEWGLSNFLAGLVGGAAFATTLLRRKPAGDVADRRGGRFCFLRGCGFHAVGGLSGRAAALAGPPVPVRFAVLLAGRLIIGLGESMANIGVTHWLVGYMGPTRTGRTLATLGMSIYGSVAIGGRLGFYLFENTGYVGLVTVSTLMPLLGLALVVGLRDDARLASGRTFTSFGSIMTTLMPLGV